MGWIWVLSILTCAGLMFFFCWFQFSLHEDFFGVPSFPVSFRFILFSWNIEETLKTGQTKREGVNRGGEKRLVGAKVILHILCSSSWKVHDTQEQHSFSHTLLFPCCTLSFTHRSSPSFSRHHSVKLNFSPWLDFGCRGLLALYILTFCVWGYKLNIRNPLIYV